MTEIPEHLLRRSRERRAALGLGGGDEGSGDEASASGGAALPAKADSAAAARTSTPAAPARAEAAALAKAEAAEAASAAAAASYIAPPTGPHKVRVPVWVMPVLVALPLWAFFYPGAFGNHKKAASTDPITIGAQVYRSSGCSGCHGANGEGGVGPALHGGVSVKTFPNEADQVKWIQTGSVPFTGQLYGDPNREGGQAGPAKGDMPPFSTLSPAQISAVVLYERTKL